MNKRKILMMALALCMVAILAVGGSLAYLTDSDADTNVFTVGNVKIDQHEKDRTGNPYDDSEPKNLYPIVDDVTVDGYHNGKNYIDKIVTVENTGSEYAFIRTFIAIPAALDDGPTDFDASTNVMHWNFASASDNNTAADSPIENDWYWTAEHDFKSDYVGNGGTWDGYVANIDGIVYNVYIATHKTAVAPEATTAPTLLGVYFDKTLDFDSENDKNQYFVVQDGKRVYFDMPMKDGKYTWDVLVASQAVQSEGFNDAYSALEHAFGNPGVTASTTAATFVCPFSGTNVIAFKDAPADNQ